MRPFNLEEALAGKPVVMRNGDRVKAVYFIKELENQKVLAVIDFDGDQGYDFYSENGKFLIGENESEYDLFMYEEPKTYYTNIYLADNSKLYAGTFLFSSRREAEDAGKNNNYYKTVEITIP
jgi:hypothetical protein